MSKHGLVPDQQTKLDRLNVLFNEQRLRNQQPDRATYKQFAESEAGSVGGRFAQHERQGVTGTRPTVNYAKLPSSNPSNQLAAVPDEPLIDARECGDQFGIALGERHEQPEYDDNPNADGLGAGDGDPLGSGYPREVAGDGNGPFPTAPSQGATEDAPLPRPVAPNILPRRKL